MYAQLEFASHPARVAYPIFAATRSGMHQAELRKNQLRGNWKV